MKTLTSLAFLAAMVGSMAANADCGKMCEPCAPKPVCAPCPAMVKQVCTPMVRVWGACGSSICCPEVVGFLGY